MRKAAFLDRDGVLNRPILRNGSIASPRCFEEFELLEGAANGVRKLQAAGFLVIVVTNQPDIARGKLDPEELRHMHHWLKESTGVDAIYTCAHDDVDACVCRKPKPGLLLSAANEWGIALGASYMVGDTWRDIGAGNAAGCQTVLVEPIGNAMHPWQVKGTPTFYARNLLFAAEMIVQLSQSTTTPSHR